MKILTIHYKKDVDKDITYYQEHIITNKQAFMFGEQLEVGSPVFFESKLCFGINNKYKEAEDCFTKKSVKNYERHELKEWKR